MATLTATGGATQLTLTGSGFTGTSTVISVNFSATGRRYVELRAVPVSGGNVSATVPVPFAGTATVAALDPATSAVQVTASSATVT